MATDKKEELEKLHWEALRLANEFENHGWSRCMTRYDAEFVNSGIKKLRDFSNRLFNLKK